MRREIRTALEAEFGRQHVTAGKKAFTVSGIPGSRAAADVVPVLRLDYVFSRSRPPALPLAVTEGIIIYGTDGSEIINFPHQHHENGKAKRQRTAHRFKKVVRSLKCLKDELVDMDRLTEGEIPSFFVESLVYRVEDEHFLYDDDRYDRVRRIVQRIHEQNSDQTFIATANEINDWKLLYGSHQPWTPERARAFAELAWARLAE